MRFVILAITAAVLSGCASTYQQQNLTAPATRLLKGKSLAIASPADGAFEGDVYAASGKMTSSAVRNAFAPFATPTTVVDSCKDLACLKASAPAKFDYYAVPEILHWEDRATEWSGKPDKIEVKLTVYEGETWKELASTIISGKSKWATMGGDHPQDLLPVPLANYVQSLY